MYVSGCASAWASRWSTADRPLRYRVPRHAGPAERFVAVGTAANVSAKGYSAPVELSVLHTVAAAVLFCGACGGCGAASAPRRWYFRGLSLPACSCWRSWATAASDGRHQTGFLAVQSAVQRVVLLPARRTSRLSSSRRATSGTRFRRRRAIYRRAGHENAQSYRDYERILLRSRLGRCVSDQ